MTTPAEDLLKSVRQRQQPGISTYECDHWGVADILWLHDSGGQLSGAFCPGCGAMWNMKELSQALVLIERERKAQ